ncbi:hypothetical protein ACLM45_04640 [Synechococcus sp. A10-1-5-9]|uniref:hypothetical protein n=1 Tax=Synechococcus sp. A10-1-5-9 TaxID=3392295 RepID=UPI0039E90446
MDDSSVTPITAPKLDDAGHLTYLGEDGQCYRVLDHLEIDHEASQRVSAALQATGPLFDQIEALCHDWIKRVAMEAMDRDEAVAMLLSNLESVLHADDEESGGPGPLR